MNNLQKHLIDLNTSVRQALIRLDELGEDAILFMVNEHQELIGSLTDGDLRRGFIQGLGFDDGIEDFLQKNPKYILEKHFSLKEIKDYRTDKIKVLPIINEHRQITDVINFNHQRSFLPIDTVIMAGGRGERLKPLTDKTPKPLLTIGDKPIIDYALDRLAYFGIYNISISLKYLGEQIESHVKQKYTHQFGQLEFLYEEIALGTAGCLSLIKTFKNDHVLLMNSDLLTNLDFEEFFDYYLENDADLLVACVPYQISIPYAVMETEKNFKVTGFKEKPTLSYLSNAGIYLMKRKCIDVIPQGECFNATDLIDKLIENGMNVMAYPFSGYWLDIGKHEDYKKAQVDIKAIKF